MAHEIHNNSVFNSCILCGVFPPFQSVIQRMRLDLVIPFVAGIVATGFCTRRELKEVSFEALVGSLMATIRENDPPTRVTWLNFISQKFIILSKQIQSHKVGCMAR